MAYHLCSTLFSRPQPLNSLPLCKYTMFLCKTQLQKKPRTPNLQKLEIFRAHMEIPGLCRKAISGSIPAAPERFCGCLLNVMTQTPKEELCKLANCIERADEKLGYVVRLLVEKQDSSEKFKNEASQLFNSIGSDVKKAYCNYLIDLCVNLNLLERACELLVLGITLRIYIGLQSRSQSQWSLYLKGLSLGAALTALHVWINDLSRVLESGEELLPVLGINTGHGKHKCSDKGLASIFESHLKELNAPFHESQIMAHKL